MAKFSGSDKMRIQTLREQGYDARAICKAYPDKCWSLSTVGKICTRVDKHDSATERKVGSGRSRTVCTTENINVVGELLCSQENQPGMSKSTWHWHFSCRFHDDLIFQQDGAPAHTACQSQEFLQVNTPDLIGKDEWPPNSPYFEFSGLLCLGAYGRELQKAQFKANVSC